MTLQKLGVVKSQIDSSPLFTLGELFIDNLENFSRYMQADGAVTAKNMYSYIASTWQIDAPLDLTVTPATAESVPACCFDGSSTAITDDYYAWVFVGPGVFTTTTAASVAADAELFGHATAGLVDDASTALLLRGIAAISLIGSATTGDFYACHGMYAVDLT